ncbi:hypothetical protein ASG25_20260 [Rhizobium sp. Leaf384]|uniref:hypothetical protein n=1 Tax=unclassified Rhizobium TaxID=2613769 RepID=UPI0007160728|nr:MULTISPECIES: hypothetical protein [unclassified Rhizobium]KQR73057.1 hypothetical protein ASG03_02635 [Rhizobium sp. Leaf341]KQS75683.1 hypothetical protein ASG25_20260 [Rhizobium sp. Leaf384]KQS75932.1 hypothetical protein ASG58_13940 [Rhizobium sp. Leaf383]
MKRLLLLTGFTLSLAAGAASAQDTPPPPPAPPAAAEAMTPPPPPPGGPRGPEEAMRGDKWHRGPDGHRPPPPSKAAHYRIETDDVKIDLKCADDEPAKACADLLMSTIDKLGVGRD